MFEGIVLDPNVLIGYAIQGFFISVGSGIGAYLVNRHFTRRLEQIEERMIRNITRIRNGTRKRKHY